MSLWHAGEDIIKHLLVDPRPIDEILNSAFSGKHREFLIDFKNKANEQSEQIAVIMLNPLRIRITDGSVGVIISVAKSH